MEVLLILQAVDKKLQDWLKNYDFVFAGARQGGHCAVLPDMEKQRMVTVEECAKAWPDPVLEEGADPKKAVAKVPMLGGGKLNAAWLADRFKWIDADGKPLKPDYSLMDSEFVAQPKGLADFEPEGEEIELNPETLEERMAK